MKTKFLIITLAALAIVALPVLSANQAVACGSKTTASADQASVKSASATDGGCGSKVNATAAVATESVDAKVSAVGADCASKTAKAASADGCASKTNATTASAKEGSCTKSADANLASGKEGSCAKSANASVASAKEGSCTKSADASLANADGKNCADKDACVNWLMANKGMTKDQALAAFEHCTESKAAAVKGVELASAKSETEATPAAEQPNN